MGTTDSNGIYFYEDTDAVSPLHTLLNLGQTSVANSVQNSIQPKKVANVAGRTSAIADRVAAGRPVTDSDPMYFYREDAGAGKQLEYTVNGTAFHTISAVSKLGYADLSAQVLVTGQETGNTWTDILSVTATSSGLPVRVEWDATAYNGASGADRNLAYRVLCDGSVIGRALYGRQFIVLAGTPRAFASFRIEHTPAAASHTWKLQAQGNVGSAVYVEAASLTVDQRP